MREAGRALLDSKGLGGFDEERRSEWCHEGEDRVIWGSRKRVSAVMKEKMGVMGVGG